MGYSTHQGFLNPDAEKRNAAPLSLIDAHINAPTPRLRTFRPDLTVVMVAPKCPGTEVREEYKRGFGVPTLIAVHTDEGAVGLGSVFTNDALVRAFAAHDAAGLEPARADLSVLRMMDALFPRG